MFELVVTRIIYAEPRTRYLIEITRDLSLARLVTHLRKFKALPLKPHETSFWTSPIEVDTKGRGRFEMSVFVGGHPSGTEHVGAISAALRTEATASYFQIASVR